MTVHHLLLRSQYSKICSEGSDASVAKTGPLRAVVNCRHGVAGAGEVVSSVSRRGRQLRHHKTGERALQL